jgi:hypothetical protein
MRIHGGPLSEVENGEFAGWMSGSGTVPAAGVKLADRRGRLARDRLFQFGLGIAKAIHRSSQNRASQDQTCKSGRPGSIATVGGRLLADLKTVFVETEV